ncbi:hypothetical protein [Sphingomonas xinjiangensis]|uniref:Carbonic anhydrase n=1 Tax=Sphingomonas xinjiangensis TaxID=643568 RepID=A0A840YDS1_9SPHN|nr:hypothetical protein [Sphingomonas xinjiangensis]MBB5708938.1 carbonic anhydrase [Sphingomonas xinjiangensis]
MADIKNSGETSAKNEDSNTSFIKTAQDAIGDAVDATVNAVKEHPVAAAAIAAGAAAAVGGAAYAVTQLRGDNDEKSDKAGATKDKADAKK